MLENLCRCLRAVGRAEKLIRLLTVLRIAVFAVALGYAALTAAMLIRQSCARG